MTMMVAAQGWSDLLDHAELATDAISGQARRGS